MGIKEAEAIAKIDEMLSAITDNDARRRILQWAYAKYMLGKTGIGMPNDYQVPMAEKPIQGRELPGIATLTPDGKMVLTVRDFKAKNKTDAGLRAALAYVLAYEKLTGKPAPSRHGLTPLLKDLRLYDGNIRAAIAEHPGIVREKDHIRLDSVARQEATNIISEIIDMKIKGKWQSSFRPHRKGKKK